MLYGTLNIKSTILHGRNKEKTRVLLRRYTAKAKKLQRLETGLDGIDKAELLDIQSLYQEVQALDGKLETLEGEERTLADEKVQKLTKLVQEKPELLQIEDNMYNEENIEAQEQLIQELTEQKEELLPLVLEGLTENNLNEDLQTASQNKKPSEVIELMDGDEAQLLGDVDRNPANSASASFTR